MDRPEIAGPYRMTREAWALLAWFATGGTFEGLVGADRGGSRWVSALGCLLLTGRPGGALVEPTLDAEGTIDGQRITPAGRRLLAAKHGEA